MGCVDDPEITAAEVRIILVWRETMIVATREALAALREEGSDPTVLLSRLHPAGHAMPVPLPLDPAQESGEAA
jgi:hypothetical protein